jgi:hypothetical protein
MQTEFVPRPLRGNPGAVVATILTGREMGLSPMQALRSIDVIEGRPSLNAGAAAAMILAAGHTISYGETSDRVATVTIKRGDNDMVGTATWTLGDAQRAGIAGKAVWLKYPRYMLRHRALMECAGMVCPDVLLGLESADPHHDSPSPVGPASVMQIPQPPVEVDEVEVAVEVAVEMVTAAQLRRLNAQLTHLQGQGPRLSADERRAVILAAAGVEPDSIGSAKELTYSQADSAIRELDSQRDANVDTLTGEIVDDEPSNDG